MNEPGSRLDSTAWRHAQAVLLDALEHPAGERNAFLDAACAGEPVLRAEVASLLSAHLRAEGFLENLDTTAAAALVDSVEGREAPPRVVGHYRIEQLLGRGGMGLVYLARDTRLDRTVALKFFPAYLSSDAAAREHLLGEARAAAALDHVNLAVVHEIAETPAGEVFIAMTYYAGSTLREWQQDGKHSIADCVTVARQIAEGLSAAHRRGIVHSDIKPSNIILTVDGVVKILDFGIARRAGSDPSESGPTRGTVAYMSPEQTRAAPLEPSSDVWSLGVLLYELIAGRRPFDGDRDIQLIRAIRDAAPVPLGELRPDVSPRLADLVHQCLQADPARRPGADRVAASLRALDESVPQTSAPRSVRSWVLAALAVVTVLLLADLPGRRRDGVIEPTLNATAMVVLPFAESVADTAMHRLGRDLVVTLSATLRAGPDLHVIEAGTVLAHPAAEAPLTVDDGAALARSLGAGRFLHGTLVSTSEGVRADAALFDTGTGSVIARASAIGAASDLNAITDSLTGSLLRQVWGRDVASIPNLGAITTHSLPALRAYVDGEHAMARAEWADAIAAFERAFAADSTFWFAYWRSLYPRVYETTSPADAARVQRVFAERSSFPPADRLLLESRVTNGPGERGPLLERVTAQFPHYWPGWYDYANHLVHFAPFLGSTYEDALSALQRVLDVNPGFKPAWEHLFWIAVQQRDTALATRAFTRLDAGIMRIPYRAVYEQFTSGRLGDSTRADIVDLLVNLNGEARIEQAATGLLAYGFSAAQVELLAEVTAKIADTERLAIHRWARASAWAARGAWDSAFIELDRSRRTAPSNRIALRGYGLATLGVVLGSVPVDTAARLRPDAMLGAPPTREELAELAWLDGVLAAMRGDTVTLRHASARLTAARSPFNDMLLRSLNAFGLLARADTVSATMALTELEYDNAAVALHTRFGAAHPFLPAIHRMAASGWLLVAGDTASAAGLLTWHEAVLSSGYAVELASRVAAPVALFHRARIEEAHQQSEPSRRHYAAFLERYDRPPASHAGWIAIATDALGRAHRD